MQISVKVEGLDKAIGHLKKIPKALEDETEKAMTQSLFLVKRNVKLRTPVDTGRLRASIGGGTFKGGSYPEGYGIKIEKERKRGIIGTNVEYAYAVEVRPARHKVGETGYFRKGVEASVSGINKFFQEAIKRLVAKLSTRYG